MFGSIAKKSAERLCGERNLQRITLTMKLPSAKMPVTAKRADFADKLDIAEHKKVYYYTKWTVTG